MSCEYLYIYYYKLLFAGTSGHAHITRTSYTTRTVDNVHRVYDYRDEGAGLGIIISVSEQNILCAVDALKIVKRRSFH